MIIEVPIQQGRWAPFLLLVIMAAGIGLRSVNFAELFVEGNVVFPGHDPYYHMVRIFDTLAQWPVVPLFDGSMNYPEGAIVIWPPLFDLFIATLAMITGYGPENVYDVETLAAWTIPVIGALTAIPTYLFARDLTNNRGGGLVAAALLMIMPLHAWYTRLGFVDHNGGVTLIQVTLFYLCYRQVRAIIEDRGTTVATSLTGGLVMGIGMLVWNGFILFPALLDLALFVTVLFVPREKVALLSRHWIVSHLLALLLILPVVVMTIQSGGEYFTYAYLSWFHPLALGASFGFAYALPLLFANTDRFRSSRFRSRVGIAVAVALTVVLLLAWQVIGEGMTWFAASGAYMSQVREMESILFLYGTFTLSVAYDGLTILFFLFPLMVIGLVFCNKERPGAVVTLPFLLTWGLGLFGLTLLQMHFAETFAPALAITSVLFFHTLQRPVTRWAAKVAGPSKGRVTVITVAFLLALIIALPPLRFQTGALFEDTVAGRIATDPDQILYRELVTAKKRLFTQQEQYGGSLSSYLLGHHIHYLTGLPVVSNGFGSNIGEDSFYDWGAFYLAETEEEAITILQRRQIRYVFIENSPHGVNTSIDILKLARNQFFQSVVRNGKVSTSFTARMLKSLYFRLNRLHGGEKRFEGGNGHELLVPALSHFRLLHDTSDDTTDGQVKIYEFVPGAILSIPLAPHEQATLIYEFTSGTGRSITYQRTIASSNREVGKVIVPYPSDRSDIGLDQPYRLVKGDTSEYQFAVPDTAIMNGDEISIDPRP